MFGPRSRVAANLARARYPRGAGSPCDGEMCDRRRGRDRRARRARHARDARGPPEDPAPGDGESQPSDDPSTFDTREDEFEWYAGRTRGPPGSSATLRGCAAGLDRGRTPNPARGDTPRAPGVFAPGVLRMLLPGVTAGRCLVAFSSTSSSVADLGSSQRMPPAGAGTSSSARKGFGTFTMGNTRPGVDIASISAGGARASRSGARRGNHDAK